MNKKINHISVIVPAYNIENFIAKGLESVLAQDYPDFEVIFIDDCSTDSTFDVAKEFEKKYSNLKCIKNDIRKFPLENFKIGVNLSKEQSICVICDGDDFFKHENVLHRINKEYAKYDCWITYGTYEHVNPYADVSGHYHAFPDDIITGNLFRKYKWIASHIRTCKKELFELVKDKDLIDDKTKKYFAFVSDLATMFPMLEMSSGIKNKIRYIPDILYCYNVGNPISENKVNQVEIDRIDSYIRNLPVYSPLTSL